jgi:hypothetical protein
MDVTARFKVVQNRRVERYFHAPYSLSWCVGLTQGYVSCFCDVDPYKMAGVYWLHSVETISTNSVLSRIIIVFHVWLRWLTKINFCFKILYKSGFPVIVAELCHHFDLFLPTCKAVHDLLQDLNNMTLCLILRQRVYPEKQSVNLPSSNPNS